MKFKRNLIILSFIIVLSAIIAVCVFTKPVKADNTTTTSEASFSNEVTTSNTTDSSVGTTSVDISYPEPTKPSIINDDKLPEPTITIKNPIQPTKQFVTQPSHVVTPTSARSEEHTV